MHSYVHVYVENCLFVHSQVHLILYHIRSHSLLRTRSGSISVRVSPQASIRRTVTVLSVAAERWLPVTGDDTYLTRQITKLQQPNCLQLWKLLRLTMPCYINKRSPWLSMTGKVLLIAVIK